MPALIFWTAVYCALVGLEGQVGYKTILLNVLMGTPYYHLWFLYMLLGLYLVTPVLGRFVRVASPGDLTYFLGIVFALTTANHCLAYTKLGSSSSMFAASMFLPYVGYYVAGYYFYRVANWRMRPAVAAFVAAVGIVALWAEVYALVRFAGLSLALSAFGYLNPFIVLSTTAVFICFVRVPDATANDSRKTPIVDAVWRTLPASTLGIYCLHPLILWGVKKWLVAEAVLTVPFAGVVAISLMVYIASFAGVMTLKKIPLLSRCV